jgi:hypothetical protein
VVGVDVVAEVLSLGGRKGAGEEGVVENTRSVGKGTPKSSYLVVFLNAK